MHGAPSIVGFLRREGPLGPIEPHVFASLGSFFVQG